MNEQAIAEDARRLRLVFALPILVALFLGGDFYWGLSNSIDELPSTLIGKPVPDFELPPVQGRTLGLLLS